MKNYTKILKQVLKNKVFHYVFSRYATYFLQFVNSIFIAIYLGPYYLGIWGFITLIIQYLNQINFGIAHSVTAITSIYKQKKLYVEKVIGTSLTLLIGLSLIVVLLFMANELFNFNLGAKYNFSKYAPVIAAIGILAYFNTLMSNIFRVYGRLIEIAINQSAFPILMFVSILLFKNEKLLWALIGANFLAFLLSFIIYIKRSPINLKPIFKWRLIKTIQIKGIYLFIYSASFYFIIISTKSFISAYYSVEEFGYFTFAFTLANVVLLLLQSFSFLIFPKLTNRLSTATTEKVKSVLELIMDIYITTSHLLIHFAILLFPLFVLFFPQYKQSSDAFIMIALTTVLYTNSFGYSCLLIAKGFEKKLGQISFFTLLINIILVYVLIKAFLMPYSYVFAATLFAYFIYALLLSYFGRNILQLNTSLGAIIREIYPNRILLPFLLSLCFTIFKASNVYYISPLVLFILINHKTLQKTKETIKHIIANPKFIDI